MGTTIEWTERERHGDSSSLGASPCLKINMENNRRSHAASARASTREHRHCQPDVHTDTNMHTHPHMIQEYRKQAEGQGIWVSCLSTLNFCRHEQASHREAIVQQFIKIYSPCAQAASKYKAGKGKSKNHVPSNKVHIPVPMSSIGFA